MSKTIFFLVPYPQGEAPSQRFRFEQYFSYLEENGFQMEIHPFLNQKTWQILYTQGNFGKKMIGILGSFIRRFFLLIKLGKADYIFIHREAAHLGLPIFEWIVAKLLRRKYIYDFDDAIWLPNYSESNKRFQRLKAYWKVKYCIKWAHKVAAGNAYLEGYAKQFNPNVQIIPTTIDTVHLHKILTNHSAEKLTVGWTGTHTTMHYLDELIPVLQELETQYDFTFLVISNQEPNYDLSSLKFLKWNKETEIEDLAKINIGVMPLQQDVWSEGKCGFKGLQYMSLEIATIMSPIGANLSIVQDGENGFLAGNLAEWKEKLIVLLENKDLRIKLGKAGRKTIVDRYSVVANKEKYLALFD